MNFTILRFDTLPSTNDEAARQARLGAAEGLCILAREQTAGRGRRGERRWHSPRDAGLYFSLVLRPKIHLKNWSLLTLAASVAVHDAILFSCELKTDIKWANDVLAAGKKISGILAETIETASGNAVVLGIGLNLKKEAVAPELVEIATSIETQTGINPDGEKVFAAVTQNWQKYYEIWHQKDGNQKIIEAWTARSSYANGKAVRVKLENTSFCGVTDGLEPDGGLRISIENNSIKTVYAGDVVALRLQND